MVITAIGASIQHDASHHRWSPYAKKRWVLITSLDDFSCKIIYADLFEQETTWAHIKAAESVMLTFGIPLRYNDVRTVLKEELVHLISLSIQNVTNPGPVC